MIPWENEFFFFENFSAGFYIIRLQVDEPLKNLHPAIFRQNIFPQIGCSVSIRIGRISLAVVVPFIEMQPERFTSFQYGRHKYIILIYSKMHQASFLE